MDPKAADTFLEPRVLVADDDPAIRKLVITILKREKVGADAAADGVEAIELLSHNSYGVILLDLMMPRVDGFGVIQYLKENPRDPKPIILVVTAYADQQFKEVDPEFVAGVVRKPFEIADVGSIVRLCVTGWVANAPAEFRGGPVVRLRSAG